MQRLDRWSEITGKLTQIRTKKHRTVITVGNSVIAVDDLVSSELEEAVGREISVVRTESGYRWFTGDEE